MTEPTRNMVTRLGWVIRPPDRLTHTPEVKLRYLGEMAELDQAELITVYMSIRNMEFSLVGVGVGDGIKHTKERRVFNFKKQCVAKMLMSDTKRPEKKRINLINIMLSHWYPEA